MIPPPLPSFVWIPLLPLAAFLLLILIGRRLPGALAGWLAALALACACGLTLGLGDTVAHGGTAAISWSWLASGASRWTLGLVVDGLSWLMLVIVTSI